MATLPLKAGKFEPTSDEAWHDQSTPASGDLTVLLLGMPCHKETVLPELRRWFMVPERRGMLKSFLQSFAGATMTIPTPKQLADYERDEAVVKAMRGTPDPGAQVRICTEHQITYQHLQEIYKAVYKRALHPPPTNGTRAGIIESAAAMLKAHTGSERVIQEMFGLKADDMKAVRAARGTR